MPFSEKIKLNVKYMAAFRCCRCHEIGIDVHHITPQAAGGSDDVDNAAPLCQNCHDRFGGNPEKQKEIKQMRDWWYGIVAEKYSPKESEKLAKINEIVLQIQKTQIDHGSEITSLTQLLNVALEEYKKTSSLNFSPANVQHIAGKFIAATRLGKNIYANFHCGKCNYSIALLIGSDVCPNCKSPAE